MIFKWFLASLLSVHGLIHLLGGLSELKIANFNNLSGQTLIPINDRVRKILGVLWLVAVALFLHASIGLLLHVPWWKNITIASVCVSQSLIIIWWHDAKVGTLANLLIISCLCFIK